MNALVQRAGLSDEHYRGGWKGNKRHGYGVQLFPNGARFIGNWKRGFAEGFGRLEFIEGTFYEGNFSKNFILEGRLEYFSGSYFEGTFHPGDIFADGKLFFRDGEVFEGRWNTEGLVESGQLTCLDGRVMILGQRNLVREESSGVVGKIIYLRKGIIYEGGLIKETYDRQGFVYGNFRHPFFFEGNYNRGKFDGRYVYHSFAHGFATEEMYTRGKDEGTWKYRTVRGYEYSADTATKRQIVRFPFLSKDFYEGELSIWCDQITLVSGTYYLFEKERQAHKQIRIIDCENITANKDVRRRFNSFEDMTALIDKARASHRRANCRGSALPLALEDGSLFRGAVVRDFVTCHKADLATLTQRIVRRSVKALSSFCILDGISALSPKLFRGTLLSGLKTGYCEVVWTDDSSYRGFFNRGKENGAGVLEVPRKFRFEGAFTEGKMTGQGTLTLFQEPKVIRGTFQDGVLNGLGYIRYPESNLEYFGDVRENLRSGKGALKFANNYKFEGKFVNDAIDTSVEPGLIVSKELELLEEGRFVPSKDQLIGFFETLDGEIFVFDLRRGLVRKTLMN